MWIYSILTLFYFSGGNFPTESGQTGTASPKRLFAKRGQKAEGQRNATAKRPDLGFEGDHKAQDQS